MKHPTGMLETDKVTYQKFKSYILTRRKPEHFFYKYQSYGISKKELDSFDDDITHILIIYNPGENKPLKYYLSRIEQWKNGLTWNNILKNNIPDPQYHVCYKDMEVFYNIEDVPEPEEVN